MKTIQLIILVLLSIGLSAQTVTVSGRQAWTDTGIDIKKGQHITLTASGTVWANGTVYGGPDGILNRPDWDTYCVVKGKPHEALIMKIGNGTPFFVGSSFSYTAEQNGRIYLGVNDNDLGNNKGEFIANLSVSNDNSNNSYSLIVPGRQIWTDSKIDVWKGQQITITASGTVYANATVYGGPEGIPNRPDWDSYCVVKGKAHEGLIMKIGNGEPIFAGKSFTYTISENGRLWFGVNDNDVGNNKGEFKVNFSLSKTKQLVGGDITVSGRKYWTSTGIQVKSGMQLNISASGKVYANGTVFGSPDGITNRPDWDVYCVVKGKPHVGLIAKIGNGKPFFVGSSYNFVAQESGELFFGVNDGDLGNNSGEFKVSVNK